VSGKGRSTRRPLAGGAWRVAAPLLAAAVVAVLVLPHAMVTLVSFARDGSWTTQLLPPAYTLDNFRQLALDPELWTPVRNSVLMALVATAGNVVVCAVAAYLVVLRRFRARGLLELLVALPWAIPHGDRDRPRLHLQPRRARGGRVLLVGTFWILPLAYFIRGVPLVASAVEGSLRQMDPSLEDAARGLGASWALTMRRVVLPAARPGSWRAPRSRRSPRWASSSRAWCSTRTATAPISVEILAQLRGLAFGTAAAYSVLLIGLVLVITVVARLLDGRAGGADARSPRRARPPSRPGRQAHASRPAGSASRPGASRLHETRAQRTHDGQPTTPHQCPPTSAAPARAPGRRPADARDKAPRSSAPPSPPRRRRRRGGEEGRREEADGEDVGRREAEARRDEGGREAEARREEARREDGGREAPGGEGRRDEGARQAAVAKQRPPQARGRPLHRPALRERLKGEITAGTRAARPGQWSARKAQLLARAYEEAGGGYEGGRDARQRHLAEWTAEEWTTADGRPAERGDGTHRYLPQEAWEQAHAGQRRATDRKKVAGSKRGRQFVANTEPARRARKEST
jgi:ABC-type spermidine/putrescine transport system permease subunit II